MSAVKRFEIAISDQTLAKIRQKVADYEWHEMPEIEPGGDRWAYGTDREYLKELCAYWVDGYNWRPHEAQLNAIPQFIATVDELDIHFLHIEGSGGNAEPLLLTHGWPGSVFEFYEAIDHLAHPQNHGGRAQDGRDLVIPALPGYGFSGKPTKPVGPRATAALWDKLMRNVLGYERYIAQGGDWGSVVTGFLGLNHSPAKGGGCAACHLNMYGVRSSDAVPQTEEELAWAQAAGTMMQLESAYMQLQMTKPQTLSYAMMDSPVGQAGWIVEKFHRWSDRRGADGSDSIENAFTKDQLLTNLMFYVATGKFNTATWFYRGLMDEGGANMPTGERVAVPTGIANYPQEFLVFPPRPMVEKGYDVVRWTDFAEGGHFAAMERPALFAADVTAFCASLSL